MKNIMIKSLFLIIPAIIVITMFVMTHFTENKSTYNNEEHENTVDNAQYQQQENVEENHIEPITKNNCPVIFIEYLIDPKYVQKVGQIGIVHGSGKYIVERSYISIKEEFWNEKIPLYAPTDMTLSMGSRYNLNGGKYLDDYALDFDVGCNIQITLGHVKEVVPSIGEQLPEANQYSNSDMLKPIKFEAGELIGYYVQQTGEGAVAGFDFITRDFNFKNKFINQERYQDRSSRNLLHGVCPYDFYTGEKKDAYYNLFGSAGGSLFKNKNCGSASRDVSGTISGMWFLNKEISGYPFEEDGYKDGNYGSILSIVGDEHEIIIGNLGNSALTRIYSNNPTYKLPETVRDQHCYQIEHNEGSQGYIYFKVIDEQSMDVYYSSSGTCPSEMPENGKRYWK